MLRIISDRIYLLKFTEKSVIVRPVCSGLHAATSRVSQSSRDYRVPHPAVPRDILILTLKICLILHKISFTLLKFAFILC